MSNMPFCPNVLGFPIKCGFISIIALKFAIVPPYSIPPIESPNESNRSRSMASDTANRAAPPPGFDDDRDISNETTNTRKDSK